MCPILHHLRGIMSGILHKHPANIALYDDATFGERIADNAVKHIGTWTFLITQSILIALWITLAEFRLIDNPQLTILNLILSLQAAVTGPLLLLASNRAAKHDRIRAETDHQILTKLDTVNEQQLEILARLDGAS